MRIQVGNKGAFVKQAFKPDLDIETLNNKIANLQFFYVRKPSKTDFFAQLDDYMSSKSKKVSKATIADCIAKSALIGHHLNGMCVQTIHEMI